jgi:hypothetical protein
MGAVQSRWRPFIQFLIIRSLGPQGMVDVLGGLMFYVIVRRQQQTSVVGRRPK